MVRLGDLLPDAARGLGLEDELRLSRAMATFERARRRAGAGGGRRLPGHPDRRVRRSIVEADAPIVAQELRLRATELLAAFAATPAGIGARELRVIGSPRRAPAAG